MFHVSFLCFNSLKIKRFKRWNIGILCFIFGFNVSFFIYHTPFPKNTHGEKSNPNGSDLKPQWERNQTPMGETPLKHWNQKWNIECQCFISWKCWLSMHCVIKMKQGTKKRLKVNIMYAYVRARLTECNVSSPASDASSPGGDASPRRHLLIKARCLDKQIQYIFLLPSWGIEPQLGNADAGTRLLKKPRCRTKV